MSPREFVGFVIFVDVFFSGFAIWMGITVSVDVPYGWPFLLAGLPAWLVVRMLLLDSPAPFLLFLTASLWAMLDLIRPTYVLMVKARRNGQQVLDGVELLPMLAAYGRRRGWREALHGVPADRLLGVLAEHPDDVRQLEEYVAAHRLLMGIAMPLARWGSASGPLC